MQTQARAISGRRPHTDLRKNTWTQGPRGRREASDLEPWFLKRGLGNPRGLPGSELLS